MAEPAGHAAESPVEAVLGTGPAYEKAAGVRRMFTEVAPRYDLLNRLLSLNIDRRWRRRAVDRLLERGDPGGLYLDACAGTLDLAREIAGRPRFHGHVLAFDFAFAMLQNGRAKVEGAPVSPACADALRLPLADGVLHGLIVGFGVRNLVSLRAGLEEFARVLRPGAPLVILDLTTPPRQPLRAAYLLYFRRMLPLVGRVISGHANAYSYLPESVMRFPEPAELARRIEAAGFTRVDWEYQSGGIAAIHVATRA